MTVWSSIKKFLNSSLGTNDFKALDKSLVGEWQLKASDEIYYDIYVDEHKNGIKTKIFKAYIDGSVRIKARSFPNTHILIYVNDVLVVDKTEFNFSQDISLSKGDILKIVTENIFLDLQICATETKKAFLQE